MPILAFSTNRDLSKRQIGSDHENQGRSFHASLCPTGHGGYKGKVEYEDLGRLYPLPKPRIKVPQMLFNFLEYQEIIGNTTTKFTWITNLTITSKKCIKNYPSSIE